MKVQGLPVDLHQRDQWVMIIGPHDGTDEEKNAALLMAQRCAKEGKTVVSCLSSDMDAQIQIGALSEGGKTIAIVHTPLEEPVAFDPHPALVEKIKQTGSILHPFLTPAAPKQEGEKIGQAEKRLIERHILGAFLCPTIIAVWNREEPIKGGMKWGVTYGLGFKKKVFRLDGDSKLHLNPSVDQQRIPWKMEMMGHTEESVSVS